MKSIQELYTELAESKLDEAKYQTVYDAAKTVFYALDDIVNGDDKNAAKKASALWKKADSIVNGLDKLKSELG